MPSILAALVTKHTHMMRSTSIALGILLSAAPLLAQKQLTNEEIWHSPTFSGDRLDGLVSMKDGVHYTTQEDDGGTSVVNMYEYKTGNKTGTILNAKDLVPAGAKEPIAMDGYHLSNVEHMVPFAIARDRGLLHRG